MSLMIRVCINTCLASKLPSYLSCAKGCAVSYTYGSHDVEKKGGEFIMIQSFGRLDFSSIGINLKKGVPVP